MSFSISKKSFVKKRIICVLAVMALGFFVSEARADVNWQGYRSGDIETALEEKPGNDIYLNITFWWKFK